MGRTATTPTPETGADQGRRRRFRPALAERVLIGLILGIAAGVFFGELAHALKIVGDAFIMLLQVAVIPYIVASLITALGRLTLDDARKLGLKAGGVLLVLWGIGVAVLLLTPLAFPDWPSASFFSTSQVEEAKPVDFLKLYIPANPFASLANAVMPAIVVFSALIGIALITVKNKQSVLEPLSAIAEALMAVTGFVARLAPYGVFALAASAAGTLDLEEIDRLQVYAIVYMTMAIILSFWVLPGLITIVTPLRYPDVLRALRGALITAFAAGSVLIVLPLVAAECKKLVGEGVESRGDGGGARSTVDVLVPAAYNIPGLGNILSLMFVLFAGWYIGSPVPLSEYPLFIGAGLASLFGGTILTIQFLLDLLKLPRDLFEFFITIDVLGTRFSTLVAVMTIATTSLVGAYALQGPLRLRLLPLLRFAAITAALVLGALLGIRRHPRLLHLCRRRALHQGSGPAGTAPAGESTAGHGLSGDSPRSPSHGNGAGGHDADTCAGGPASLLSKGQFPVLVLQCRRPAGRVRHRAGAPPCPEPGAAARAAAGAGRGQGGCGAPSRCRGVRSLCVDDGHLGAAHGGVHHDHPGVYLIGRIHRPRSSASRLRTLGCHPRARRFGPHRRS